VPRISGVLGNHDLDVLERRRARPAALARYAGQAASVDSGELIAGSLPPRARALVAEWAALHEDELLANWDRAQNDEPLQPIDPLP
jgi:hypothetical protein